MTRAVSPAGVPLLHAFSLDMLERSGDAAFQLRVRALDGLPRDEVYDTFIRVPAVARVIARDLGIPEQWPRFLAALNCDIRIAPSTTPLVYVARYRGSFPRPDQDLPRDAAVDYWELNLTPV